jgi:hypothetical protein
MLQGPFCARHVHEWPSTAECGTQVEMRDLGNSCPEKVAPADGSYPTVR